MEEIAELKRRLAEERPQAWDAFPDIGLYMDPDHLLYAPPAHPLRRGGEPHLSHGEQLH